jgi:hypothetical protein
VETFDNDANHSPRQHSAGLSDSERSRLHRHHFGQSPLRRVEVIGIGCLIVICDVAIYRGHGYAGYALLFAAAPLLLWISSSRGRRHGAFGIVAGMLLILAAKLLWCGSAALVTIGFALVVAFAVTLAGICPYVSRTLAFAARAPFDGIRAIHHYGRSANLVGPVMPRVRWVNFFLPAMAFTIFGGIFILANPKLVTSFGEGVRHIFDVLERWFNWLSPDLFEIGFWFVCLCLVAGLLRPTTRLARATDAVDEHRRGSGVSSDIESASTDSYLYPALRNTLITVIVLFAIYLVFEFETLWFRDFKQGFHYSGYAHRGSAWLTFALALATVLLSVGFRGAILRDPRIGFLRRLAWLWSLENIILAIAVYNRLFIYVGFNGMSRMRIVGLYGMSAVVVGFLLVIWKIIHNRPFLWLVQRHLWTVAIAIYLLAITPLDTIVVSYNVRRILAGDPAPCVQISVHPINSEGVLLLLPLTECDDEIIRDGVRAMLAQRRFHAIAKGRNQSIRAARRGDKLRWTAYQLADALALREFRTNEERWKRIAGNRKDHNAILSRFHDYAYQWY